MSINKRNFSSIEWTVPRAKLICSILNNWWSHLSFKPKHILNNCNAKKNERELHLKNIERFYSAVNKTICLYNSLTFNDSKRKVPFKKLSYGWFLLQKAFGVSRWTKKEAEKIP
jgi:hypothetical protein